MVMTMMGLGFLLIVGLGLWLVWEQRDKLVGVSGATATAMGLGHGSAHAPEEVARGRYARGEIDRAEYEEMMATLNG
jgi:uncharacterized membrane protein